MKDIDFDELDRAVSTVLEPVADATPTSTPATPVDEKTQPAGEAEKTSDVASEVATPDAVEPTPVTAVVEPEASSATPAARPPLAIKRRGQFMDVVHPSSDMTGKPEDGTPTSPRKVTVQPLTTIEAPEAEPETPAPTEEETQVTDQLTDLSTIEMPDEAQPPVETVESAPVVQVIPDPLDVMQTQEEAKDTLSTETPEVEDTPVDAPVPTETESGAEEVAPTTPFLADTKVDKRPLDAFSPDEAEVPAETDVEPTAEVEPVSAELQADVVAVEANPTDQVNDEADTEHVETDKKDEVESGFNNSIPQQYAADDAKTDEDHSIYDTSEYHQPITPVKTKKRGLPGWLVALLVMFLLAGLSAAGGYFWFYYGL